MVTWENGIISLADGYELTEGLISNDTPILESFVLKNKSTDDKNIPSGNNALSIKNDCANGSYTGNCCAGILENDCGILGNVTTGIIIELVGVGVGIIIDAVGVGVLVGVGLINECDGVTDGVAVLVGVGVNECDGVTDGVIDGVGVGVGVGLTLKSI